MNSMKKFEQIMYEEDINFIGKNLYHSGVLNEMQQEAIWQGIYQNSYNTSFLDENELIYVLNKEEGFEYLIPAIYKSYIYDYGFDIIYFSDMLPLITKVTFNKENMIGIIYCLIDQDNRQKIFLNNDAFKILKTMMPDEIKTYINSAIKDDEIINLRRRK